MSNLINTPDAARLIKSLRDTGYNVNSAFADIVDNSIAAGANHVKIRIDMLHDGNKVVLVGDDGCGMDQAGVFNAMRYGSAKRETPGSLGKFGIGLKTASSSICRRYSLLSRKSPDQPIAKLTWDLDHVEATNSWEMLEEAVSPEEREQFQELCGKTGTLLIWDNCDRILPRDYGTGAKGQAAITRLADSVANHISTVFHRFLDTKDKRERNIQIDLNGKPLEPWNPFYPEKSEQVLAEDQQTITFPGPEGVNLSAGIKAWILPHRNQLTKEQEEKFARITNKGQGFYIFREGRLIQDGGWLKVFGAPEPHYSLIRIEFDFNHQLDELFRIDVKKSRILFHEDQREVLKTLLRPAYREAGNRYGGQNRRVIAALNNVDHGSANRDIAATPNTQKPTVQSANPETNTAEITNKHGPNIRIKAPVCNHVDPNKIFVEAVDTIDSGCLWEPALRSPGNTNHASAVHLNKNHQFYTKVYQRAAANGYAVEGMDFLLYAFALAEQNNSNDEMGPIFEDIRMEISSNLYKLLRHLPDPDIAEIAPDKDD